MQFQFCQTVRPLILALLAASPVLSFHPLTVQDHLLVGYVFQTMEADWVQCIEMCHKNPLCVSYNYNRSRGPGACQLNNEGVKNLCEQEASLVYQEGFVFQQLKFSQQRNKQVEYARAHQQSSGCQIVDISCDVDVCKVGCFQDVISNRSLPEIIIPKIAINWVHYDSILKSLTCTCATEAKKKGFVMFGIQFYGECWSGADVEKTYNKHGKALTCYASSTNSNATKACENTNKALKNTSPCGGSDFVNYVYMIV